MKFSKFSIENYKGIKDLSIHFGEEKRIYTLVGLNESGKTSILDAINVFTNQISKDERHKYIPKSEKFSFNGVIRISATMELDYEDIYGVTSFLEARGYKDIAVGDIITVKRTYEFKNSKPTDYQSYWIIEIDLRKNEDGDENEEVDLKRLYDTDIDDWRATIKYIEEKLFPKIVYYPNFLFDFPERIYLENYKGDTIEFTKFKDVVQDILFTLSPTLDVDKDVLERLKSPSPDNEEVLDLLLAKMSESVSKIVFSAWEKLFSRGNKEIVIKHGKELVGGNMQYYLQFKLKEGGDQFFISERSLGFKWFFSFLLFTGLRKNRVSDKSEVLFLLDEPASNLHPTAQKNLLKTFEEILSKSSLIYTTHSHYLINPEWIYGMYIVKNKAVNYKNDLSFDNNVTDIEITPYKRFIATYPDQKEYFQPILDTLDYQPGLIEKVPSIAILEGKNDFYTLLYFNKVIFDDKFQINLYPAGGATSDEQIIRLYIAWNRKFVLLKDADRAGKKAIETYKKIFPIYLDGRAFTLADVKSEFDNKAMEDIFTEEEKLEIVKVVDPSSNSYNKSKFNLAIQILLQERKTILLSDATVNNFEDILAFLEEKCKD